MLRPTQIFRRKKRSARSIQTTYGQKDVRRLWPWLFGQCLAQIMRFAFICILHVEFKTQAMFLILEHMSTWQEQLFPFVIMSLSYLSRLLVLTQKFLWSIFIFERDFTAVCWNKKNVSYQICILCSPKKKSLEHPVTGLSVRQSVRPQFVSGP